MRLICDAKINTPIAAQYSNKDIERVNRIARVPPTELLMFCLEPRDAAFVRAEFHDTLRTVRLPNLGGHHAVQRKRNYKLWLKVVHIEKEQHITPSSNDRENRKLNRIDVILVDTTKDNLPAVLSLYDEQMQLMTMLARGDYIGLYHPHCSDAQTHSQMSRSDVVLECAQDTVLFYMSAENARLAGLAKTTSTAFSLSSYTDSQSTMGKPDNTNNNSRRPSRPEIMSRDDEGYIDCAMYPDRIYLGDLAPCMLNVTLFGFVKSVASNNPYLAEGKKMDRYAIRIADATDKMDVTLWAEAGRNARKLQPGHYVLLTNLGTSEKSRGAKGSVWYINGSSMYGTEVFNISTTQALLTSSWMRQIEPISALSDRGQCQIDVVIVGWELHTPQGVVLSDQHDCWASGSYGSIADVVIVDAHNVCHRVLQKDEQGKYVCAFCACSVPANHVVQMFRAKPIKSANKNLASNEIGWIEWRLDDGSEQTITAYGSEEVLISDSAEHFKLMLHEEQIVCLDSVLGKPFLCSVSTTGKDMYRIDQVTPRKFTSQECMETMKAIKVQEKRITATTTTAALI
ncbi:hypothetical protein BX666DRAFT_1118060 [Dichotomocladium elegans]|nr:hypothetical protein BX666DRAFT_1118060 [Dichotomocladium elegans]